MKKFISLFLALLCLAFTLISCTEAEKPVEAATTYSATVNMTYSSSISNTAYAVLVTPGADAGTNSNWINSASITFSASTTAAINAIEISAGTYDMYVFIDMDSNGSFSSGDKYAKQLNVTISQNLVISIASADWGTK